MVRKISKYLAYVLFFFLALMYFTPKVALYYFVEHKLQPLGVIITDEKVSDNGFSLSLENAIITFKGIESAKIKRVNVKQFVLYNSFVAQDIKLSQAAASMLPTKVASVNISYILFKPFNISIDAQGDFGDLEGSLDILEMHLHLKLKPSKKMRTSYRSTLRNLKKSKEGDYTYDKTFKL